MQLEGEGVGCGVGERCGWIRETHETAEGARTGRRKARSEERCATAAAEIRDTSLAETVKREAMVCGGRGGGGLEERERARERPTTRF